MKPVCYVPFVSLLWLISGCANESDNSPADTHDSSLTDAGEDSGENVEPVCVTTDTDPDFLTELGCMKDYIAVASEPLASGIPGTLSSKTIVDRLNNDHLTFQNSRRYPIHFDFASTHLSGNGLPMVTDISAFNETEYYSPSRRFVLGSVNYYEGPKVWAYEIASYDTASAEMIRSAFDSIRSHVWFGDELRFHPSSDTVAREAEKMGDGIPVITTQELFAGIDYQPLNLAEAVGRLVFFTAEELETEYLAYRDIAVLKTIPNDISVCSGTITEAFQTPLSHINVLAQNRNTPNMALRGAFDNPELRALEGEWVKLTVGPQTYTVVKVTQEEADQWWEDNKPTEITIPPADLSVTDFRDVEDILDIDTLGLEESLAVAIPAFGGKASHYSAFPHIDAVAIPYPKAFGVPIYYYSQFMSEHGFDKRIQDMLAEETFKREPKVREESLEKLRDDMMLAPLDPDFEAQLLEKLETDYPGIRMRFRSSTNCEDLGGFTGAGLYTSKSAELTEPEKTVADAVRKVWGSVWRFRAFEEREYRGITHDNVGMALLVHRSFPDESINGVAITSNIFDTSGMEPGYYINAQVGEISVVLPPAGVTSDQFVYHFDMPGQPTVFLDHSSLVPDGENVMTRSQTAELAESLGAIHVFFNPLYGPNTPDHFYGMDVEFKFNTDGPEPPTLVIKQARPYPGRGKLQ